MPPAVVPYLSAETEKYVKRPAQSSWPPTASEIVTSLHFAQDILVANGRKQAKEEEVIESELYKNKLLSSRHGAEPPWFMEAMERMLDAKLKPINTVLSQVQTDVGILKEDVGTLKEDVRELKEDLASVRRTAAITYNMSAGNGDEAGYAIVPFPNGQDPTRNPHNLPPLKCAKDIRSLSANSNRRDQYFKGYYPLGPAERLPPITERIDKIFLAIGAKNY